MSKKSDYEEWGHRLDAGHTDDELLRLAAELEQTPPPVDPMPAAAKTGLRQRLVDQHPQVNRSIFGWLRTATSTAVALSILTAVVGFAWLSFGNRPSTGTAVSVPRATPTAQATPTEETTLTTAPLPFLEAPAVISSPNVTFNDRITLAHFSLTPPPYLPGNSIDGLFHWIFAEPDELTASLHLIDSDGQLAAQLDVSISSEIEDQPFQMILPADLQPGNYDLRLIVYEAISQARLAAANGQMAVSLYTITIEALPAESQNIINIERVTIGANTGFITNQKTMTVTIDVNLTTIETGTVVAKLLVREGAELLRGVVSSSAAVSADDSTITIAIPLTDMEVQPPATLMLAAELYADDASGPPLAAHTEPFLQWRYDPSATGTDTAALLEAVQLQRHTAIVTFEVRVATHVESGDTAVHQMYLANPDWEENWEISDSQELDFMPSATNPGAMKLTTTPEQIRNATNTDNPILIVEMWPCSSGNRCERSAIAPLRFRFPECPMDLTRTDGIVCVPD